jgi:hypothetical protein
MGVEGEVLLDTFYKGHKYSLQFYVVDHPATQPILGLKSCEQFNLIYRVEMFESQITAESIFDKYEDVFSTATIGCLPVQHHIAIDESVKPVVHPPRNVPAALRPKIKSELDRMEQMGVISCQMMRRLKLSYRCLNQLPSKICNGLWD